MSSSLSLLVFFLTMVILGIFLFVDLKDRPNQTLSYIKTYIYIAFGLCLFAFFQAYLYLSTGNIIGALWNIPGKFPRLGSLFWDVNHFGGLLAALLPVVGALILASKKFKHRIGWFFLFAPMSVVLLLTNSRTAWISAFAAFFVFIFLLLLKRFGTKGVLVLLLVFVLGAGGVFAEYQRDGSPFRNKVRDFFHYRMDSFDAHFMLLEGSVQIFDKYPVLGGGYGGFFEHFADTKVAPKYFGRDPAAFTTRVPAHTIWGEIISETGLAGLGVFVLFVGLILGTLFYSAFVAETSEQTLVSAAMFAAIIGWLTAGIFYSYNSEFFFITLFLYFLYGVGSLGKNYSINSVLVFFRDRTDLGLVFIAALAFLLLFVSLGRNHLIPWDEAIYAGIARNMLKLRDYMVMEWVPGRVWYEKPPLMMGLMAGFMNLLEVGELAARLPSAIAGFLTVFVVYSWSKRMFGKGAGFVSGLALLTSVHFLYYARASMMDVTVTFFITLALYLYYIAKQNPRPLYWPLSGLSIGFAVMTKGVVGLLPFPIIGLYELFLFAFDGQKLDVALIKRYLLLVIYMLVVAMPWHLFMHLRFGAAFWENYIGYHVFDRAVSAIEDKGQPFFWYLVVMKVSMRIWFVALIPAFFYGLVRGVKKHKDFVFLMTWGLFIFLFFSVAKSKLIWYITPVYPMVAILVGVFLRDAIDWGLRSLQLLFSRPRELWQAPSTVFVQIKGAKEPVPLVYFLAYFSLAFFGLTYFYFHKNMVYTGDLTGSQAKLLKLKDENFGTNTMVYADRIELPLVLFYSEGPHRIVDYTPLKKILNSASVGDQIIFITKESRFEALKEHFPAITFVAQEKEWVLGYLLVK